MPHPPFIYDCEKTNVLILFRFLHRTGRLLMEMRNFIQRSINDTKMGLGEELHM